MNPSDPPAPKACDAQRLLIIQAAALGYALAREAGWDHPAGMTAAPLTSPFPAVTSTAQATFRTALPPARHGMVANGFLDGARRRVCFWEQAADLVEGPRIWESFRAAGRRVAMLFWQQSLGEQVDQVLSPAPIHKHHGGMIDACFSRPADLYEQLCARLGSRFALRHYWGPLASTRASDWIARATAALLADPERRPDLCLTYLPGLDYNLQRYGPGHPRARHAFAQVRQQIETLVAAARAQGYEILLFGDYAIAPCGGEAVFPNQRLAQTGWFQTRTVAGRRYPDLFHSPAFAMVDHEIAHVYLRKAADREAVATVLGALPGVGEVWGPAELSAAGLAHPRAGDLLLLAEPGRWFAYPWWTRDREAPDYARHIDIHQKPGFDPCELFFGWPPGSVTRDTRRIGGTHGRIDPGREALWASTCFAPEPLTLIELAAKTRDWLCGQ